MKDDTIPIKVPLRVHKIPKSIYVLISFLVVLIIILASLIFIDRNGIDDASTPGLIELQIAIRNITELEAKIQRMHQDTHKLIIDYKSLSDEDISSSIDIFNPGEDDKNLLQSRIDEEKDEAKKSLLQQILENSISIAENQHSLKALEAQLPEPHIVKKGENHFQICLDYLVKEKAFEIDKARQLIDKDKLLSSIVPGFKVWNFFSGREFATFITRGDASVSPAEVRRLAKQKLIEEKNRAIKELNSLYYIIDTRKNLAKKDILEGGLFKPYRLKKVPDRHFKYSIDMRIRNKIYIFASSFKMNIIEDIDLFPKFYKEGKDYKISIRKDKRRATLTILNREGFKKARVVISVE